jgi:hypothetical protein
MSLPEPAPNNPVELTAYSVRSCVAPASGSGSPGAFGIYGLRSGAMTGQQVRVTIIASLLSGLVGVLVSFFFFRR